MGARLARPAAPPAPALLRRLKSIDMVVLDVDGTLTDGRVIASRAGESLSFHIHDGWGLVQLLRAGLAVAWVSGRASPAARIRAAELGVRELCLGVKDKRRALVELQARLGVPASRTLACGDDLPDLGLAREALLFAAPANARAEVLAHADWRLRSSGGAGAVRELAEGVLHARGKWRACVAQHGG
jgi:3-deoxy-D-manno-octulosonate 8-phosphate phosphatase (KDO 8-P phosphatase)